MHPVLSSKRVWLLVLTLWLVLSFLLATTIAEFARIPAHQGLVLFTPWYFILLFFCLSNYYICDRLPLTKLALIWVFTAHVVSAIATISIWLAVGYFWTSFAPTESLNDLSIYFSDTLVFNISLGTSLYIIWIIFHYIYLIARGDEQENNETLRQRLLINQIELQVLRTTVHPHFLYNSLAMLANLSLSAPEKIHSLCVQMAEFLRYSVNYGKKSEVTIQDELTHIQNYLSIEKERFGERLSIEYNVADEVKSGTILPLILFPLIENCIKHGIDSSTETGFIKVKIFKQENQIIIEISNSFDPMGNQPTKTLLGQQSLNKRLAVYYGKSATMQIDKQKYQYCVTLQLPAKSSVIAGQPT